LAQSNKLLHDARAERTVMGQNCQTKKLFNSRAQINHHRNIVKLLCYDVHLRLFFTAL
jgi:hypothetical protein